MELDRTCMLSMREPRIDDLILHFYEAEWSPAKIESKLSRPIFCRRAYSC